MISIPRILTILLVTLFGAGDLSAAGKMRPMPGNLEKPAAKFEFRVEKSVFIPMRDGIRLSTDIYFPINGEKKRPVILLRTPYSKSSGEYVSAAQFFAGQGFAVAVQDFRGKFESEGVYQFDRGHRKDGYDTMEWLTQQPWSNGNIGTYGCSYVGEVQLYQGPALPPGLKAMVPQAAGTAIGSAGGIYQNATDLGGGLWILSVGLDWFLHNGSKVYYHPPEGYSREQYVAFSKYFQTGPDIPRRDLTDILWSLPVIDMMKKAKGPPTDYEEFVSHTMDLTDPWWSQFNYITEKDRIDAPTLFISSWNDLAAYGALYMRNLFERTALSKLSRDNQYIIVSPTSHCQSESATAKTMIGNLDAGDPRFGYFDIYIKWFNHWLRGENNDITKMPKVQYYLLVKNEWRAADKWPIPGTRFVDFYLGSDGAANSHFGDGKLANSIPVTGAADSFIYDPGNPVMSSGVNDYVGTKPIEDQRRISARNDVLVYTSEPLEKGFEMTGDIEVVLYVSSSAKDTDFIAKLVDVYPDGTAFNLREGAIRARFRNGRDKPPAFMKPGEVYEVHIRLGAYSSYFEAGHRIRLQVTSSSFPRYDRNLNTGGNNFDETVWVVAHNKVLHSKEYPSHVIIPVVE
jgi:hypothetical protein